VFRADDLAVPHRGAVAAIESLVGLVLTVEIYNTTSS
jgi:hypothetical protein